MLAHGRKICPLLSVPGVKNTLFKVDWLHAVDAGVGADFLGNEFKTLLTKFAGNRDDQCNALWDEIQQYYKVHDEIKDRMKSFAYKNIRTSGDKAPKLRGTNAASVRGLIKFGHLAAEKFLDDSVPMEAAIRSAAYHLLMCYECLSDESIFRRDVLRDSSAKFALQYAALRDRSHDPAWRLKPKLHLFLHLCSQETRPNLYWTYRDEDFMGSVAHQSKMRGSWKRAKSFNIHALELFAIQNPEPRMIAL